MSGESISVRVANDSDLPALSDLLIQLHPDDASSDSGNKVDDALRETFNKIASSTFFTLFVAETEGHVVGTCYLNVIPNLTRSAAPYALIENVVTDSSHRRKGIGTALMQHAITCALEQGCYKVMLLSGRGSSVHEFYKSCGMQMNEKTAFVVRA